MHNKFGQDIIGDFHRSIKQQAINIMLEEWDKIYLLGEVRKVADSTLKTDYNYTTKSSLYYVASKTQSIIRYANLNNKNAVSKALKEDVFKLACTVFDLYKAAEAIEAGRTWDAIALTIEKSGSFEVTHYHNFGLRYKALSEKFFIDTEFLWASDIFGYEPTSADLAKQQLR